jgi:HK97 family phage major capsid protein
MSLLDIVRGKIADALNKREAHQAELDAVIDAASTEARDLNDTEAVAFAEAKAAIDSVDTDLKALRAREAELVEVEARKAAASALPATYGGAVVRKEARTYEPHARDRSFFADAYRSQFGYDGGSRERIERHMREVEVERRDITSGTLNGLIPPLYLLDQAAELARAMRPFADVVPQYELPANGMSVVVTRVTTGTATAAQTSQNTAVHEVDLVTTDLTVSVNTIAGQQDVSRQALERGAITDELIFRDLVADYATRLDAQVINGSGSNGQHVGILGVSGIGTESYAATTVAAFYGAVNAALADVATGRFAPATVIVMHPRRWHWLLSKADTAGRPFVVPAAPVASNPIGLGQTGYGPVGTLAGLPVIADANVPTNLGSSTDEDRVIVTRLSDHALWEAPLMTFSFDQAVNPPATIRLAVAGYSAFTAGRYPSATSVVQGTGLVAPTYG